MSERSTSHVVLRVWARYLRRMSPPAAHALSEPSAFSTKKLREAFTAANTASTYASMARACASLWNFSHRPALNAGTPARSGYSSSPNTIRS